MSAFVTTMEVALGANHLRPGRTRHTISNSATQQEFPPFVRLEIAKYPGDQGWYLLHICEDGSMADTYHETVEEALHQAEWESGIQRNEWHVVPQEDSAQCDPEKK
jgi:hypothetical protein